MRFQNLSLSDYVGVWSLRPYLKPIAESTATLSKLKENINFKFNMIEILHTDCAYKHQW